MHSSTFIPLATLLAQTGAGTQTVGANVPSVAYWLALILVAAGLGLIVIVALAWLRGRDTADALSASAEEQAFAAYAPGTGSLGAMPALSQETTINATPTVGTTQEAERLLRLMGEAEELCTRLARDLDERADRLERLMARANGMLGTTLAEQRMPQPPQPAPMPAPAPQPYQIPQQQPAQARPEIITRPVGVPVMAAAPAYQPGPAPQGAPAPSHAHIPAPAPRLPAPPPIPQQQQYYGQPQHQQQAQQPHQHAANNGAAGMYGQAYPAEAEVLAQQIFRLADAGLTPGEIAQRLGQHTGKVELIIALRNA